MPAPQFDDWIEYCFTRGCADFRDEGSGTHYYSLQTYFLEEGREQHIPVTTAADFLCRFFRDPAVAADRFTDEQLADGLWFIFGVASHYFPYVRRDPVPADLQTKLLTALTPLYEVLLDPVCCRRGKADTSTNCVEEEYLDNAVWMIWDMIGFDAEGVNAGLFPAEAPHQAGIALDVLEGILSKCRTSTCHMSALHALGHLHARHSQRVVPMIDRHLDRPGVAGWVRDYALKARSGDVL